MSPVTRMPRAARSEQLLEAAERLIAGRGVVATSMADVADAVGVTKPVVYDHFRSKDGLLCALIARAGDELYRRTTDAVAGAIGPIDALERGLRAYFDTLDRRDRVWWALLDATAAVSPATFAALEAIRDRQAEFIVGLMSSELGVDRDDAVVYAHIVVGACERLAALRAQRPGLSVERATSDLLNVLWSGFASLQRDPLSRTTIVPSRERARSVRTDPRGAARSGSPRSR